MNPQGWRKREPAEVRAIGEWFLKRARSADIAHPYLAAKGIKPHGKLALWRGSLVLPLRDLDGILHSLQFIAPDGSTEFLADGSLATCFYTVAGRTDGPLVICLEYAAGATIHEATRIAVVAAMNAADLPAVAKALRAKWPDRDMVIAGDADHSTTGTSIITKATDAAKAIGARLAIPTFRQARNGATTFNDLAQDEGAGSVGRQIETATIPPETDREAFARLAKLPPVEYDRIRDEEANRLGIRIGTLDGEVAKLRPQAADNTAQGTAVDLADVEPWTNPVDGAEVLSAVAATFSRYVAMPPGAADAVALWVAHTHAFEAFIHTPRLNVCSPDKQCGKTLLLDVAASMVSRPLRTESITPAVLFRLVESHKPTLLLDEVDAYLREAEELRGLLNAGHKRSGCVYRCEGESKTVRGFDVFAPAALAGIGDLPGTLHDRSIVIRLVRAKPGEVSARFDSRKTAAETELARKLARWTADNFAALESCDPTLPDGAYNRIADNWRLLFAIAQVAGGDWPARAADAFARLTATDDREAQGIGVTSLADIADIFAAAKTDRLQSVILANHLAEIEGRPWGEFGKGQRPITANQVAKLLRRFGVTPHTIRIGTDTAKGYELADFKEAFDRFLQPSQIPKRHTVTTPENIDDSGTSEPSQPETMLPFKNTVSADKHGLCDGVTVPAPTTPEGDPEQRLIL